METKEKILDAAKDLFAKSGFANVSVRDIAEEAGTALSAVHYHFESKEQLLYILATRFVEEQTSLSLQALTSPKSAQDFELRLYVFTDTLIQSLLKDLSLFKIIQNELAYENSILKKMKTNTIHDWFQKFVEYFNAAKKLGFLDKACSSEMAATILIREITHTVKDDDWNSQHYKKSLRDRKQRERFIQELISIVLRGILKK